MLTSVLLGEANAVLDAPVFQLQNCPFGIIYPFTTSNLKTTALLLFPLELYFKFGILLVILFSLLIQGLLVFNEIHPFMLSVMSESFVKNMLT